MKGDELTAGEWRMLRALEGGTLGAAQLAAAAGCDYGDGRGLLATLVDRDLVTGSANSFLLTYVGVALLDDVDELLARAEA